MPQERHALYFGNAARRAIISRVRQLRGEAGQRGMQLVLGDLRPTVALGENGSSLSKPTNYPDRANQAVRSG